LTIILYETDDEDKDIAFMNRIFEIIKDSRGHDELHLRIISPDHVTNLKMANTFIDISPDLKKRLGQLVSPDNLIIEKV
jgi:hypothetical protein